METDVDSAHERRPILARNPDFEFPKDLPRHWFAGNAFATHLVNGVNLLFPAGERFFVRSVRKYLDVIADDPALVEQVKGFFGQEGRHAQMHERFFEALAAQGYDVEGFLRWYEKIAYERIEPRASDKLRLSVTVALEHFTAILAEAALSERLLDEAHPAVRDLLFWHAAEEIEHRAVAFDVLKKVSKSYALRMVGLVVATVVLGAFWIVATRALLKKDGLLGTRELGAARRAIRAKAKSDVVTRVFLRGFLEYARPGFHPSQKEIDDLASAYLATAGLA